MLLIVVLYFKLYKFCKNCLFCKMGVIELVFGCFEGIVKQFVDDDYSMFLCYEIVYSVCSGGEWNDDGEYIVSGCESMCVGVMILLEKLGWLIVVMCFGCVLGVYDFVCLYVVFDVVIEL